MNTITEPDPTEIHATIKLGIDAYAKWFYVGRQHDGDFDVVSLTQTPIPDS